MVSMPCIYVPAEKKGRSSFLIGALPINIIHTPYIHTPYIPSDKVTECSYDHSITHPA